MEVFEFQTLDFRKRLPGLHRRPGGRARVTYHGAGYYLRYLENGPGLMPRIYGLRSLVNT